MTRRREKAKPVKPELNNQLETEVVIKESKVNQRQEKFADFLIDVAKYVFTGVVITSLFNDVSDKTILYLLGMLIVLVTLLLGLSLTNKGKE